MNFEQATELDIKHFLLNFLYKDIHTFLSINKLSRGDNWSYRAVWRLSEAINRFFRGEPVPDEIRPTVEKYFWTLNNKVLKSIARSGEYLGKGHFSFDQPGQVEIFLNDLNKQVEVLDLEKQKQQAIENEGSLSSDVSSDSRENNAIHQQRWLECQRKIQTIQNVISGFLQSTDEHSVKIGMQKGSAQLGTAFYLAILKKICEPQENNQLLSNTTSPAEHQLYIEILEGMSFLLNKAEEHIIEDPYGQEFSEILLAYFYLELKDAMMRRYKEKANNSNTNEHAEGSMQGRPR